VPGRHALIVATDTYADPKLRRLRAPAHDAEALADVLRDPEIGEFEVELASNESDAVLRRRIAAFFANRARDELLLLHFSCHGLKDDSGQLFFAASDTEVDHLDATAIPAEFVSRQMARSRSRNVLMLLDCCYSGAIARGLRFRAGESVDVNDHLGGSGRVIITASDAMEYAFEGDELTGEGQPSVFTSAVVKALASGEADRDQDHWISVRELYDYVCDQVRDITPNQRPNMLSHLEGELYVARSRWLAPATLPRELLDALENPIVSVREGAVRALAELMAGRDRALAAAARGQLEAVAATDDSRRVSGAASEALGAPAAAPAVEAPLDPKPAPAPPAPREAGAAPPPAPPPSRPTPVDDSPPAPVDEPAAPPARTRAWVSVRRWPAAQVRRAAPLPTTARLGLGAAAAGALLVVAWFLPWLYGGPVPARWADIDSATQVWFCVPLAAGVLTLALAPLEVIGRMARRRILWLVAALPAAGAIGLAVLYRSERSTVEFNVGFYLSAIAGALALVLCGRLALAGPSRSARRLEWGDGIAAAGGVALLVGVLDVRIYLQSTTFQIAIAAAAFPIVALALRAVPRAAGSRWLALAAAAAGAFVMAGTGTTVPEHGWVFAGGALAILGGVLGIHARSART
jgi:hypothetical protein